MNFDFLNYVYAQKNKYVNTTKVVQDLMVSVSPIYNRAQGKREY